MANRIKIRHGSGIPTNTELLPYELGWNGLALYINNSNNQDNSNATLVALPMNGGKLTGNLDVEKAGEIYVGVKNTNIGAAIYLKANNDENHGIYSSGYYKNSTFISDGKWLIYRNSDGDVVLNGKATVAICSDKVFITDTNPSSVITYYPIFSNGKVADTQYSLLATNHYYLYDYGTASNGVYLSIGATNYKGGLVLHDNNSYFGTLSINTLTANRTYTLPDNTGTIALVTDNVASATKLLNTPNNTTTFLRGDNTWTNILTSSLRAINLETINTTTNKSQINFLFSDRNDNVYGTINVSRSTGNGAIFDFNEYSEDSSGNLLNYYEKYLLPTPTQGLGENKSYNILTSKNVITVEQGGTGKTTKQQAVNNLLVGIDRYAGNMADNIYFLRSDSAGTSFGLAQGVTFYNYIKNKLKSDGNVLEKSANYTLAPSDVGSFIIYHSNNDYTVTIPDDSNIPVGAEYTILRHGIQSNGQLADGHVYIQKVANIYITTKAGSSDGHYSSTTKWDLSTRCAVLIKKISADTWYINGDHIAIQN